MKAFTDHPFAFLGDEEGQKAPIRECLVLSYDGNKYCKIIVDGEEAEVKTGYLYKDAGRFGDAAPIEINELNGGDA